MTRQPILPPLIAVAAAAVVVAGVAPAVAKPAAHAAAAKTGGQKSGSRTPTAKAAAAGAHTGAPKSGARKSGKTAPAAPTAGAHQSGAPGSGGAARMPHGFESNRPWAAGVSAADQKQAVVLFERGNKLLQQSLYSDAVKTYSAALKHWDHPAIHYNMALALRNLDQPVRLYENLKKAVAYGVAPLDEAKYRNARAYMQLIGATLARVDISCDVTGAQVSMDGRLLFTAPGHYHGIVLPGDHNIVATKAGFVTDNETRTLAPGGKASFKLHLYTAEQLTRYHRRWSRWKPWAVVGAGAAIGVAGGILQLVASQDFDSYDAGIRACNGCVPDAHLSGLRSTARTDQAVAIVSYAVAGAAIVGGVALVYANRPRPYRIETDHAGPTPPRVSVAPLLGGGTTGVTALFRF